MDPLHYNYYSDPYTYFPYRQEQTNQQNAQPSQQQPGSSANLPSIDPTTFIESSRVVRDLLSEAALISNQLINTDIGREIMEAAQKSDTQTIYRLLRAIGMKNNFRVTYTPHAINITVSPPNQNQTGTLQTTVTLQMVWNKSF